MIFNSQVSHCTNESSTFEDDGNLLVGSCD